MGLGIEAIAVLVAVEVRLGRIFIATLDLVQRLVVPQHRVGVDYLGPVRQQSLLALFAGVLGHHQRNPVAENRAYHRVGDSRVSRSGVDDGLLPGQLAGQDGFHQHSEHGPVLYGPAGVQVLALGAHRRVSHVDGQIQPHHRRVADGRERRVFRHEFFVLF